MVGAVFVFKESAFHAGTSVLLTVNFLTVAVLHFSYSLCSAFLVLFVLIILKKSNFISSF